MKKVILLIAFLIATSLTIFTFTAQANSSFVFNTVEMNEEYVQVNFKDLPAETQELLIAEFSDYEIKAIFQNVETKLLKVVVVKDEEERTFTQNEEGKFVE